jgi:nicotinamidase/pyrazinamidase
MTPATALVVVDVQRDFCPGGALAAEGGERILPALNRHIADAGAAGLTVYATRDWHPLETNHFVTSGGRWPPHCVQGTPGAEFHPDLRLPAETIVVSKGTDPDHPGYSAFDGRTPEGMTFAEDLRARQIDRLIVTGIATDYCVKQTVLDARREGFRVSVLLDAVTGIDAQPGDVGRALDEMSAAGAQLQQP